MKISANVSLEVKYEVPEGVTEADVREDLHKNIEQAIDINELLSAKDTSLGKCTVDKYSMDVQVVSESNFAVGHYEDGSVTDRDSELIGD